MTKIGRKGFTLAEVVVVSVVISTVLVTLYAGLNNVSSAYETRNRYYDVDSLYVAMEINDILIRENTIGTLINDNKVVSLDERVDSFMTFYKNYIKFNISHSYFVPYDSAKLNELKDDEINQTFKDYIDYLNGNVDFNDDDYNYMIIVERENVDNEDDCYYYALKLKYSDIQ